jgi:hypothetical protein
MMIRSRHLPDDREPPIIQVIKAPICLTTYELRFEYGERDSITRMVLYFDARGTKITLVNPYDLESCYQLVIRAPGDIEIRESTADQWENKKIKGEKTSKLSLKS